MTTPVDSPIVPPHKTVVPAAISLHDTVSGIHSERRKLIRDLYRIMTRWARPWQIYDLVAALLSASLGYWLSPFREIGLSSLVGIPMPEAVIFFYGVSFVLTAFAVGLYDGHAFRRHTLSPLVPSATAAALAWGIVLLGYYLITYQNIGRYVVAISWAGATLAATFPRLLMMVISSRVTERVILIGSRQYEESLHRMTDQIGASSFRIVQTLEPVSSELNRPPLHEICARSDADVVLLAPDSNSYGLDQGVECIGRGVRVTDYSTFYEETFEKVPADCIDLSWFVSANIRLTRPLSVALKRVFDLTLSTLGLLFTLPLYPLIATLVKLSSRGPVFYRQARIGLGGRQFMILKFRTMIADAEQGLGARWATENDPRVTWLGRILRKTRLDEIPQFFNVLLGDMTFVGPRPERPEFTETLQQSIHHYRLRHLVKPGITGWAQIRFPYGNSAEHAHEKLCYDLYYIKHGSLAMDALIVLRTLGSLMRGAL